MKKRFAMITAGVLGLAAAGCGAKAEKAVEANAAPRPIPVTVAPLARRPVERTIDIVGTLKGWEEVTVGSKKMGRVAKVFHDMGDRVKPGEPLVELETVDADLAVEQSEKRLMAELAKLGLKELPAKDFDVTTVPSVVQAKVAIDRAELNVSIQRGLYRQNAGVRQELQNAENDLASAHASYDNAIVSARSSLASALAAKVALDVAKQSRVDMVIRAPKPTNLPKGYTGPVSYSVTRRKVSEGQMVRDGDAIAELVIEEGLRLWSEVPERYASQVQLGQTVRLTVESRPGETFQGKVTRINPSVDPTSRTFQVETAVPNQDGLLRPGAFAKAHIVTRSDAEAIVVPREAMYRFAGVIEVFLLNGDKAHAIPVTTDLEGRDWVEVHGQLPAQGQVITSGQTQLADGTPVVVREPEKTASESAGGAR